MASRGIDLEASTVAEEEEIDRTAVCELEAAEALAGMARNLRDDGLGSAELRRLPVTEAVGTSFHPSQDRPKVNQQFHDYASTMITIPEKIESIVKKVPSQLCSTSCQLNSMGKSKPKLTKVEKEDRKIRRILSNRESARQTIQRRKAMHLELTGRAADILEENETLKKEKELSVEEYNSLKDRNKFLKTMLAKAKKAEQGGMQEERMTSSSEHPCSTATNPAIVSHNQPSIVPCVWPSILSSSEGFQFQYASGSNPMSSSHFLMPCFLQGQENSADIDRQGASASASASASAPLFVVAVPWLLPFPTHSSTPDFNSGPDDTRNAHPSVLRIDNNQLSSSIQDMNAEASNSVRPGHVVASGKVTSGRHVESLRPLRNAQLDVSSAPESSTFRHNSFHKNQEPVVCSPGKAKGAYSGTMARRRRKELMRLKNIHGEYDNLHYSASG